MSDADRISQYEGQSEQLLLDFDLAWNPAAITRFAERVEPLPISIRTAVFRRAVLIDLERLWRAGVRRYVEHYSTHFGALLGTRVHKSLVLGEVVARLTVGEEVTLDELSRRFRVDPDVLSGVLAEAKLQLTEPGRSADLRSTSTPPADETYVGGGGLRMRCPQCGRTFKLRQAERVDDLICRSCDHELVPESADQSERADLNQLGRFELLQPVGSGAFGTVWKARDPKLDRVVAIKVPHARRMDGRGLELFFREARAVAKLKHKNIVGIHEIGSADDSIFIVSEYIDGCTLKEWLAGNSLTPMQAADLVARLLDAVAHAHSSDIVHRDLKPGNILIDGLKNPHITDFGLAKNLSGDITMTATGQILGTPAYMSPEQASGDGQRAGVASDQFSLGVILFELLTGELPFVGPTHAVLQQITTAPTPSLRAINPDIPAPLEAICHRAMAKDPQDRYPDVSEFRTDILRWLSGDTVAAERTAPPGFDRLTRRRPARRWPVVTGVFLLAVACVALFVSFREDEAASGSTPGTEIVGTPPPDDSSPETESGLVKFLNTRGPLVLLGPEDEAPTGAHTRTQLVSTVGRHVEALVQSHPELLSHSPQLTAAAIAAAAMAADKPAVWQQRLGGCGVSLLPDVVRVEPRIAQGQTGVVATVEGRFFTTADWSDRQAMSEAAWVVERVAESVGAMAAARPTVQFTAGNTLPVWDNGHVESTGWRLDPKSRIHPLELRSHRFHAEVRISLSRSGPFVEPPGGPEFVRDVLGRASDDPRSDHAVRLVSMPEARDPVCLPVTDLQVSYQRAIRAAQPAPVWGALAEERALPAATVPEYYTPRSNLKTSGHYVFAGEEETPSLSGIRFNLVTGIVPAAEQQREFAEAYARAVRPEIRLGQLPYLKPRVERQSSPDGVTWDTKWAECLPPAGPPKIRSVDAVSWPMVTAAAPELLWQPSKQVISPVRPAPTIAPAKMGALSVLLQRHCEPAAAGAKPTFRSLVSDAVRLPQEHECFTDVATLLALDGPDAARDVLLAVAREPILFRYFDTDVEAGTHYRYRVQLVIQGLAGPANQTFVSEWCPSGPARSAHDHRLVLEADGRWSSYVWLPQYEGAVVQRFQSLGEGQQIVFPHVAYLRPPRVLTAGNGIDPELGMEFGDEAGFYGAADAGGSKRRRRGEAESDPDAGGAGALGGLGPGDLEEGAPGLEDPPPAQSDPKSEEPVVGTVTKGWIYPGAKNAPKWWIGSAQVVQDTGLTFVEFNAKLRFAVVMGRDGDVFRLWHSPADQTLITGLSQATSNDQWAQFITPAETVRVTRTMLKTNPPSERNLNALLGGVWKTPAFSESSFGHSAPASVEIGNDRWRDRRKGLPTLKEFSPIKTTPSPVQQNRLRTLAAQWSQAFTQPIMPSKSRTPTKFMRPQAVRQQLLVEFRRVPANSPARELFAESIVQELDAAIDRFDPPARLNAIYLLGLMDPASRTPPGPSLTPYPGAVALILRSLKKPNQPTGIQFACIRALTPHLRTRTLTAVQANQFVEAATPLIASPNPALATAVLTACREALGLAPESKRGIEAQVRQVLLQPATSHEVRSACLRAMVAFDADTADSPTISADLVRLALKASGDSPTTYHESRLVAYNLRTACLQLGGQHAEVVRSLITEFSDAVASGETAVNRDRMQRARRRMAQWLDANGAGVRPR